ncbi:MAG: hypothetical protein M3Q65_04575 [Chloroflexota bacterium]|nr:hypothetical protein [Chloroflexota bacterium]
MLRDSAEPHKCDELVHTPVDGSHASSRPPVHMLHLLVAENGGLDGKDRKHW